MVFSGSAVPDRLKQSKPASRSTNVKLSPRDEGSDSRIRRPAYKKESVVVCLRMDGGTVQV